MTKNTKLSGTCRKTRCSSKCIYYAYMLLFYSYQLFMCEIVWNCCMHNKCMGLYRNLITRLQSNPNNSNLQRKEKKVRVIGSSWKLSRVKLYRKINDLKGNENCFELAGGLSYRGFKFPGVNCIFVGKWLRNKWAPR